MRKKIPLTLALLGGAAGFAARKWQLSVGFEPDTHLPIPGAPSAMVPAVLAVLVAAAVLVLIFPNKDRQPASTAFSAAQDNAVYLTAVVLAGFLLLVSAGFEVFSFSEFYGAGSFDESNRVTRIASMVLPPLRVLFCVVGLPCAVLWGRTLYRGEAPEEKVSLLGLCFLFCLWLITAYQTRAADPVIMDYVYEVLSIVCSLLGLYCIAGYSFQTGKPRRTVFFCLMGAFFSLVTLADGHTYAEMARLGFAVLFLSAHAALILHQPAAAAAVTEDETGAAPGAETEAEDHG